MRKASRNVNRFSAKAASRRSLVCYVIGFIAVVAVAAAGILAWAFNEPMALSLHALEFTPGEPEFMEYLLPRAATRDAGLGK
jgi:hypothetical protein